MTMASPAIADIKAAGPKLTDADGDRIPDTNAGVAAIYRHITANGVETPNGELAIAASNLAEVFVDRAAEQVTAMVIQVESFAGAGVIKPAEDALNAVATQLAAESDDLSAGVTGDVLAQFPSMDASTRSMLVSLPLALLLALIIASVMLRSIRYAFVSVSPIGLVVIGIYAFMATFGYTVNMVTATIAAIAVGVGIDFTARFREELNATGTALEAVRRSGMGTGGALVLSALTSVLGFLAMALAPTPIFATFGALTAVMIVLSPMVALLILPSLLVLATHRRTEVEDTSSAAAKEVLHV
jgi:predicted RND superfamily exporter protein